MLMLKYLLITSGVGFAASGLAVLVRDHVGRSLAIRWRLGIGLVTGSLLPLLLGLGLVVVPSGRAAVRVSQISGAVPGALGPGVHMITPFLEDVAVYDLRERVLTLQATEDPKSKAQAFRAQTKEGLAIGLAVTVRYRLDPRRLDQVQGGLPAAEELVPAVVASVFRQLVPSYTLREVFAAKREEIRQKAAQAITERLAGDAILVREVMLRDVQLPPEYAKGLEGLLLKEQENERMVFDIQIKEKEVRSAELEAEAAKARQVKQAEGQAAVRVLQAKAEADAMQHTLPLKEKQIEQSRLEAEARKEALLKNAEAAAQAKVIDSKAEVERSNLLAGAEAFRIRVTSAAESERMKIESDLLRENPLLIQKIVAERLSDKMQIMMVPMDGRNFFANEVFREAVLPPVAAPPAESQTAAKSKTARR